VPLAAARFERPAPASHSARCWSHRIVAAQIPPAAPKLSVLELLWKWTPLLAEGFLFNLLISFCAMAVGTVPAC
jgi:polar amino acid transport system permease protein